MKKFSLIVLGLMLSLSSLHAQTVVVISPPSLHVGIPWEIDIPCVASNWKTGLPNNAPVVDFWSISLPPAMWSVTGQVTFIPLSSSVTKTEAHVISSARSAAYWQSLSPPLNTEPSPAGGSLAGDHDLAAVGQGGVIQIGRRFFDYRANSGPAPVYIEGLFSWSGSGGIALCGHIVAEPTVLP